MSRLGPRGAVMRTGWGIVTSALVAALVAVPTASSEVLGSSHGLQYVEKLGTIVHGISWSGSVACKRKRPATGGGVLFGGSASAVTVTRSLPRASRLHNGWAAGAFYELPAPPIAATITRGICERRSTDLKYVSTKGRIGAAPAAATKVANCPEKRAVAGGGVRIGGAAGEVHLNSSYPVDDGDANQKPEDGWRAYVANDAGGPKSFTVFAICARKPAGLEYLEAEVELPAAPAQKSVGKVLGNRAVVAGGVFIEGSSLDARITAMYPYDPDEADTDVLPDDGWFVSASNDAGAAKTLRIWAIAKG